MGPSFANAVNGTNKPSLHFFSFQWLFWKVHWCQMQYVTKLGCLFTDVAYLPTTLACFQTGIWTTVEGQRTWHTFQQNNRLSLNSPSSEAVLKNNWDQLVRLRLCSWAWADNTSLLLGVTASASHGGGWATAAPVPLRWGGSFGTSSLTVTFPPAKPQLLMCLHGSLTQGLKAQVQLFK